VSDRVWTHTRRLGQVSGTKRVGTAVLHHEKYEPWNAFQSQDVCSRSVLLAHISERDRSDFGRFSAGEIDSYQDSLPIRSSEHIAKSVLI
jgi:hypothetical protein